MARDNKKSTVKNPKARAIWLKICYVLILVTATFITLIGVQLGLGLLLQLILPQGSLDSTLASAAFSFISYLITGGILIFLPAKIFPQLARPTREKLGLSGLLTWTDLGLGPVGYVASILLAAGLTSLFSLLPWFDASQAQDVGYSIYLQGLERGIAFVMLAIVAPIMEELIFRGWFYGKLRVRVPKLVAILVTSLLFGVVHLQWNVGITVFAMSVVTCTLREVTGTIYAGTLVHIINNAVAFYLVFVANMV